MKKIKPNSAETTVGKFTVVVYFYFILFTYLKTIKDFLKIPQAKKSIINSAKNTSGMFFIKMD